MMKYFDKDPNGLLRGPGYYYLRSKGYYSKVVDKKEVLQRPSFNIPKNKEIIDYIKKGGKINGIPDEEHKKILDKF